MSYTGYYSCLRVHYTPTLRFSQPYLPPHPGFNTPCLCPEAKYKIMWKRTGGCMPQKCNLAFGKYANNYFSANQEITAYENNFLFLFFFFTTNEMKICLCLVKSTVSPEYCPPPSPCPPPQQAILSQAVKKSPYCPCWQPVRTLVPLVAGQCYCR